MGTEEEDEGAGAPPVGTAEDDGAPAVLVSGFDNGAFSKSPDAVTFAEDSGFSTEETRSPSYSVVVTGFAAAG